MKIYYAFILSIVVSFLFCAAYYYSNVYARQSQSVLNLPLGQNIIFSVFNVEYKKNQGNIQEQYKKYQNKDDDCLTITGAIIPVGKNLDRVNNNYYLLNERTNKAYKINSAMFKNYSATEFVNDGFNYENSGLKGYGCVNSLPRGVYRIIADSNKEFLLYSDVYIQLYN